MTDQELEELLKEDPDKILHTYFKKFIEPKFNAMHESLRLLLRRSTALQIR